MCIWCLWELKECVRFLRPLSTSCNSADPLRISAPRTRYLRAHRGSPKARGNGMSSVQGLSIPGLCQIRKHCPRSSEGRVRTEVIRYYFLLGSPGTRHKSEVVAGLRASFQFLACWSAKPRGSDFGRQCPVPHNLNQTSLGMGGSGQRLTRLEEEAASERDGTGSPRSVRTGFPSGTGPWTGVEALPLL